MKGIEFQRKRLREGCVYEGIALERCSFKSCVVHCGDFDDRAEFRSVSLSSCRGEGCGLSGAKFVGCSFKNMGYKGLLQAWSCSFERVTLAGDFGRIAIGHSIGDEWTVFNRRLAVEQSAVEWALDISSVVAKELEIRRIPVDLVRRDRETQVIIRRARLASTDWESEVRGLPYFAIEGMLDDDVDACLVIAPKGDKKTFAEVMKDIEKLRELGIAE